LKYLYRLYAQQFKTTLATMFAYRASLIIWMIGQILEPLVYLIVWTIVSNSNGGSVGGVSTGQFAAYYLLLMVVNQVTYTWIMYEFEYRIREGILSFALLKPVHPIHSDIADNVSSKIITTTFVLIVAFALAFLFRPELSPSLWAVVLFFPVLVLAFAVRFLLEWTLAQTAFWTTRVSAANQTYFVVMLFLSGQFAPLSLLPPAVRLIANLLPFKWMIAFPIDLLSGRLTLAQTAVGIGAQCGWLIASLILFRVVWKAGVRVYSAVGA
jgi:ABC-2 type transport system permease protein